MKPLPSLPVVILCGGMGTRLKEETEFKPKPLVNIGGKPILWHIMKHYAHHGQRRFVLCLGYKGNLIRDYFLNYDAYSQDCTIHLGTRRRIEYHEHHQADDWSVTLAETGPTTNTGGRLLRAARYLDADTFFLTYGDGVSDVPLDELYAFHKQCGRMATVTGVRPPSRFGELSLAGDRVAAFTEKPQIQDGWINGGFFVFERNALEFISDDDMLEGAPLERLAREGQLSLYRHEGFWRCMDTYRDMERLNELWADGNAPWRLR